MFKVMLVLLSAILLIAMQASALASPKDDADTAITRGIALRREGRDAAAVEEFRRAKSLFPSPRATAQLGLGLQAAGKWADAESELREAMSAVDDPWIGKYRQTLDQALDTVVGHVGSLEIRGTPAGAEVLVDQRRVGVLPMKAIRVTAGTVVVEVRAPGYLPVTRDSKVSAGTVNVETVELTSEAVALSAAVVSGRSAPVEETQPSPSIERSSGHDGRVTGAWVSGITAAVLAGAGVAALVVRGERGSDLARKTGVEHSCSQTGDTFSGPQAPTCVDLATSKQTWTGIAVGTFAAAGLTAGLAVVLGVTGASRADGRHASRGVATPHVSASIDQQQIAVSTDWVF